MAKTPRPDKKMKNRPPTHNLCSGSKPPNSVNRESPQNNQFDALTTSDDESIPPRSMENKIDDLSTVIDSMNTNMNNRFESILKVLNVHNTLFVDNGMLTTDGTTPPVSSTSDADQKVQPPVPFSANTTTVPPAGCIPFTTGHTTADKKVKPDEKPDFSQSCLQSKTSIDPHAPSSTPTDPSAPKFAQNEFSVIISGATKIKYMSMESYLKDKTLADDSAREIEKLYVDILMSLTFVFEMNLSFLPQYKSLSRNINFEELFRHNLHGFTMNKCRSVFL